MKKSLLITLDFPPNMGGVAAYWQRVCHGFSEAELVVLTSVSRSPDRIGDVQVLKHQLLAHFFWPHWTLGLIRTFFVVRKHTIRQLIAAQLLPLGTIAYVLFKLTGLPYIVQVYGMDIVAAQQSPRKAKLARLILSSAHAVVANSEATAKLAQSCAGKEIRVVVVYPVPEVVAASSSTVSELRSRYALNDKRVILTIGRLVERKGQDKLIEALPAIRQKVPNAVYVIVGDGPDQGRLSTLAKEQGCAIVFTGAVSEEQRNAWFSLCEVFAMPSRPLAGDIEGFGMVYLEAAAFAKPVVAGNSGGVTEAVEDGVTGLCVDGSSATEIAAAVAKLLKEPTFAKHLGEEGKRRIETKWNWEEMLNRFRQTLL